MIAWLESIDPDVPVMIGMIFALIIVATVSCAFMVGVYHALKHRRWPLAVGSVVALGAVSLFFLTGGFEIIDEAGGAVAEAVEDFGDEVSDLGDEIGEFGDEVGEVGDDLGEAVSDIMSDMESIGVAQPRIALGTEAVAPKVELVAAAPPMPPGPAAPPEAEITEWSEAEENEEEEVETPAWVIAAREGDDGASDDQDKLSRVFVSDPFATVKACRAETQKMIERWAREWAEEEGADAQLVVERALRGSLWPEFEKACRLVLTEHVAPRDTSVGRVYELYTRAEVDLPAVRDFVVEQAARINKRRGVEKVAGTGVAVLAVVASLNLWLRSGKRVDSDKTV